MGISTHNTWSFITKLALIIAYPSHARLVPPPFGRTTTCRTSNTCPSCARARSLGAQLSHNSEGLTKRLGRRDIIITWRGIVTNLEWIVDLMDYLRAAELNNVHPHPDMKVEAGFVNLYTAREHDCRFCKRSARDQVLSELRRMLQKYRGEKLSITIMGHSLGRALAMLSAYDIAELGLNHAGNDDQVESILTMVFSFAGPRVRNVAFKDRCEELGLKFLRVVNVHDSVPKVPGIRFNEKLQMMKRWIHKLPWS